MVLNPLAILLFLFVFAPLAELYVLIEVGSEIGALPTILLSIFTAILGASLVRLQGFSVLMRARGMMARGEAPAIEMMEGMALAITGFALLLPGFITDAIGFLLLITPVRRALIIKGLLRGGVMRPASGTQSHTHQHIEIEGEFRREDHPNDRF
ncbi:MAG: FxsA family protein [Sedimenticolaceae bacterium]